MADEKPPRKRGAKSASEPKPKREPKPKYRRKKWLDSLGPRARAYEERGDVPPPPGPESTVQERVEYIANEMVLGRWDGYISRAPLAKAWALTDSRVQQIATEAHRLVAYDPQQREEKRMALAAFVAQQRERAAAMKNRITGLPDFAAALKAAELEAKFVGIEFEEQVVRDEVAMRIVVEADDAPAAPAPSESSAPPDSEPKP